MLREAPQHRWAAERGISANPSFPNVIWDKLWFPTPFGQKTGPLGEWVQLVVPVSAGCGHIDSPIGRLWRGASGAGPQGPRTWILCGVSSRRSRGPESRALPRLELEAPGDSARCEKSDRAPSDRIALLGADNRFFATCAGCAVGSIELYSCQGPTSIELGLNSHRARPQLHCETTSRLQFMWENFPLGTITEKWHLFNGRPQQLCEAGLNTRHAIRRGCTGSPVARQVSETCPLPAFLPVF